MQLVVIRHAIAEEPQIAASAESADAARALTPQGRQRMALGAQGLRCLIPHLDRIVTSPLLRATQTAALIATVYQNAAPLPTPLLAPGTAIAAIIPWLTDQLAEPPTLSNVAIIGHEPDLSQLIAWLTAGKVTSFVHLGKGGAALLVLNTMPDGLRGELRWLLTPRQLRQFGRIQ